MKKLEQSLIREARSHLKKAEMLSTASPDAQSVVEGAQAVGMTPEQWLRSELTSAFTSCSAICSLAHTDSGLSSKAAEALRQIESGVANVSRNEGINRRIEKTKQQKQTKLVKPSSTGDMIGPYPASKVNCPTCKRENVLLHTRGPSGPVKPVSACPHFVAHVVDDSGAGNFEFKC